MTTAQQPAILAHPNFDTEDYVYLSAKGWRNAEILARWAEEAARGNGPCRWAGDIPCAKLAAVTGRQKD